MMLALLVIVASCRLYASDYAFRNGAKEALDDIGAGRQPKLYWHVQAQINLSSRTPGLYCPPPGSLDVERVEIPEAAWSESGRASNWEEMYEGEDARAFAYLYNMTMFRANENKWKRSCPGLVIMPYEPQQN